MDYHWGIERVKKRKHSGVGKEDAGEQEDNKGPEEKKATNLMASESDACTKVTARGNPMPGK